MVREITEADWKVFRSLHPIALERFCERVLAEVGEALNNSGQSAQERYLSVYRLVKRRDKELAEAFSDLRRSTARMYIMLIRSRGLWTEEEFGRFSAEMREAVDRTLRG